MSIPVKCRCGERFRAPDKRAGKSTRCPSCDRLVDVPFDDEDDDQESNTRTAVRKTKKKKSGSNTGIRVLIFSLVALVAVVVLGGGAIGVYFLVRKVAKTIDKPPGDGFAVHEKYLPENTRSIGSHRFAKIPSKNSDDDPDAKRLGIQRKEILRTTTAYVNDAMNETTIITTSVPIDVERLVRNEGGTEVKVGKYKMYRGESHVGWVEGTTQVAHYQTLAWAVPESYVFLTGPADDIEAILNRDGKPQLSERMRKGMELVNHDLYYSGVGDGTWGGPVDEEVIATYSERTIDSNLVDSAYKVYKDPETAERKRKEWDAEEKLNAQRRGPVPGRTDTVTRNGNTVVHTMTLTGGHPR
jgi:hypothetical protein